MNIRMVKKSEIDSVKKIADSLLVTRETQNKKCGFYDYSLTLDQYMRRAESPFFLVAETASGLEGFCMAYDSEFVNQLKQKEPELNDDVVFRYLSNLKKPYVYIDQFAFREHGTTASSLAAIKMADALVMQAKLSDIQTMLCAVAHSPWKNHPAVKIVSSYGFRLAEELDTEKKIVLGMYRFDV